MIYKVLGSLLFIEVVLMLACYITSYFYNEDDSPAFAVSTLITVIGGFTLRYFGRDADNNLSRKDSYLVVTLAWTVFSIFGMLPFLLSGYVTNITDAFFESMSGFTTTGASIIDDVEALPHGILLWRTLMQWIGGLGIVFFTIALLPSMVGGSVKVFAAEATGPIKTKLHPRLSTSAKWIWMIYIILTIACMGCYHLFGMNAFDAVNYGMSTTATGGFGTHNMTTEFFNSRPIEYTCAIFCFLSGINFVLLWTAVARLRIRQLFRNTEFRFYVTFIAALTAFIMLELIIRNSYSIEHAFRSAFFNIVSFVTTTGVLNDDASQWPRVTWIVMGICMFCGGMAGSTSGGFKNIRIVMMLKAIKNEFRQLLHPNAVLPVHVDGNIISQQKRNSLFALFAIFIVLSLIAALALTAMGIDAINSLTIILGCLTNVGPTLSIDIGPAMSWSVIPDAGKWLCTFYMLLGRLEIFSVLIIFTGAFWKEN